MYVEVPLNFQTAAVNYFSVSFWTTGIYRAAAASDCPVMCLSVMGMCVVLDTHNTQK